MAAMLLTLAACGQDAVIATVNGEPVYESEYKYYVSNSYLQYYYNYYDAMNTYYQVDLLNEESASGTLGEMEKYYFDTVIDNEIIKQLAEEKGLTLEFGDWLKEFLDQQSYNQLVVNEYYEQLYNLTREELLANLEIDDATLQAAYDEDPTQWIGRSSSNIVILCDTADEAALAEAYAKAQEVIAKLDAGEDFAELAAEYSDDTNVSLPYVNAAGVFLDNSGSLVSEYTDALFTLANEGDYTAEPVLSSYGYHIIRYDEGLETFDAVKDYISASMTTVSDEDVSAALSEMLQEKRDASDIVIKKDVYRYYSEETAAGNDEESQLEGTEENTGSTEDDQSSEGTENTGEEGVAE